MRAGGGFPGKTLAPEFRAAFDHPTHRLGILFARSKIPAFREARAILPEFFREKQVTAEGLEHMLPRTHGFRISNGGNAPIERRAHQVGIKTVSAPVAATNYIASARGGHRLGAFCSAVDERAAVGSCGLLVATLYARA